MAVDITQRIITYLLDQSAVTNLTGADRIVGAVDGSELPAWYKPEQGPLVMVAERGGPSVSRGGTLPAARPGIWIFCYAPTDLAAIALESIVTPLLHKGPLPVHLETSRQLGQNDVGWVFAFTIFRSFITF